MIRVLQIFFLVFLTYSFLGWCIEVILKYIQYRRFINRGFLIGPYCPIYGWGALLMTILLQKYNNDPVVLLVLGMTICSVLEYFTSYVLEKIFNARWWDYSDKKFNIDGRICLNTMIPFGISGVLIVHYINPILFNIYKNINSVAINIITLVLFLIFLIDNIVSFNVLSLVRKDNKLLEKDNTEEMSRKVIEKIKNSGILAKRLLFAFPNFHHINIVIKRARFKFKEKKVKPNDKHMKIIKKTEEKYNKKLKKGTKSN